MNITVVGMGYVGLSIAMLLSKNNNVVGLDIDSKKIKMINNGMSPIHDKDIQEHLSIKCKAHQVTKSPRTVAAAAVDARATSDAEMLLAVWLKAGCLMI